MVACGMWPKDGCIACAFTLEAPSDPDPAADTIMQCHAGTNPSGYPTIPLCHPSKTSDSREQDLRGSAPIFEIGIQKSGTCTFLKITISTCKSLFDPSLTSAEICSYLELLELIRYCGNFHLGFYTILVLWQAASLRRLVVGARLFAIPRFCSIPRSCSICFTLVLVSGSGLAALASCLGGSGLPTLPFLPFESYRMIGRTQMFLRIGIPVVHCKTWLCDACHVRIW